MSGTGIDSSKAQSITEVSEEFAKFMKKTEIDLVPRPKSIGYHLNATLESAQMSTRF